MGKSLNSNSVVEAKQEYTRHLCNFLKPLIYDGLMSMYTTSIESCEDKDKESLLYFQKELENVPLWNSEVIQDETNRILEDCVYFHELLTAVFISNVRILSSVKLSNTKKKVEITIPNNDKFIHKCYVNVSKLIYSDPYLFSLKKYDNNIFNNTKDVYMVIEDAITDAIRDLLPIKSILNSYLCDDDNEEIEDTEDTEDAEDTEEIEDTENTEEIDNEHKEEPSVEFEGHDAEPVPNPDPELDEPKNIPLDNVAKKSMVDNFFDAPSNKENHQEPNDIIIPEEHLDEHVDNTEESPVNKTAKQSMSFL
jgi:hypothetical protein